MSIVSKYTEKTITWDEFAEQFKPIQNTISNREEFNGWLFETYDKDFTHVAKANKANPNKVWTILDSDGVILITSGMCLVNRLGYVITEVPCPNDTLVTVVDEEDIRRAQNEAEEELLDEE